MDAPAVEFWFDFASTYSYPAAMRIEEAAARVGAPLAWWRDRWGAAGP